MNYIKVLGIGSPLGDDQAGWKVAEALTQNLSLYSAISPYIEIERHDRPGVRLIELIKGFKNVLIIDAVKSGSPLGTIHQFKKEEILHSDHRMSTHEIGIFHALQLANALQELPEHILFYGIEIDEITLDSTLSPEVLKAIENLSLRLKNEIVHSYAT